MVFMLREIREEPWFSMKQYCKDHSQHWHNEDFWSRRIQSRADGAHESKKIACITYHKHPKDDWQVDEFRPQILQTVAGNQIEVYLSERSTRLTKTLWVREIRRLRKNGHQTSILSTDYRSYSVIIGSKIGDWWCQENFFKYMRQRYNLDRLVDCSLGSIPETAMVTNPVPGDAAAINL